MFLMDNADFIVGRYKIKINKEYDFDEAMDIIATEESIGIESIAFRDRIRVYPGITDLSEKIKEKFSAKFKIIEQYDDYSGLVNFYFPLDNILQEYGTINILLSTMMGDLFGLEVIEEIFLVDIAWPKNYLSNFPGPKFGIDGIRKIVGDDYPFLGVIIKPNLGLTPKETGNLVYKLALSGASFIKDDELLSSTKRSPIFERLKYSMEALDKAERKRGKKCLFALNVTSDSINTYDIALKAVEHGANCIMLNVFSVGFDTLKAIAAEKKIDVPIHTHRCMHDIYTSRKNFGVSLLVFSEMARMCGADFFHIGTVPGKSRDELNGIMETLESLISDYRMFKKVIPISSRSSVASIESTHDILKTKELMYLCCGAVYKRGKDSLQEAISGMREAIDYYTKKEDYRTKNYYDSQEFVENLKKFL